MTKIPLESAAAPRHGGDPQDERSLPRIVHVIPYDGIGGVEIATASVDAGHYDGFVFSKAFIATIGKVAEPRPCVYESGVGPENNPRAFVRTIRHLLKARPHVLVLSLWRSCIVGLAVKALRPRTRLVLILHNTRHSNMVDAVLTQVTARLASAIWADSPSSAVQRLGPAWVARTRPISFLIRRMERVTGAAPSPYFITWGRLHPRKRIELALDFFALVHARHPCARFTIIGPDRGEGAMLQAKAAALGVQDAVDFAGPADLDRIARYARDCAFFVQTSRAEGMGMAVVEAMQLGLVPVVTPVGEIGTYVADGRNGICFTSPQDALEKVERLLADPKSYHAMSRAATQTWEGRPLYSEEFLAACGELASGVAVR
jgi:glycosyltransferase involved in cell wall biosynthesis